MQKETSLLAMPDAPTPRQALALLILVVLMTLLPNIAWVMFANGKHYDFSTPYAIVSGLMPAIILVLLVFALLGRHLWLGVLVLLPFLPLVPIESTYIFHYGEPSWYAMIATAFESNSREVVDYLGPSLWPLLVACVFCLITGLAAIVLLWKTRLAWQGRSRALAIIACVTLILFTLAFETLTAAKRTSPASATGSPATVEDDSATVLDTYALERSFPIGVPMRILHWYSDRTAMLAQVASHRSFLFGARSQRDLPKREIYVLVLGEASRADHWQLYGYNRATNPKLETASNLVRLSDMVTPWSASRMSVPIIVSRKKGTDPEGYFPERAVMRAFSEAGFVTYWISNQIAFGGYDSPISVVAHDADHVSFHNVADYTNPGSYDEVLIPPLKAAIDSGARKLFVVLHTLGSHENYAYRYPDQFDVFKPSLKEVARVDIDQPSQAENIQNSYDNSIVYTDELITKVIEVLHATGAISTMWYVSDHGEDLINASCKLTGHGSGTVNNFRIPSVFWYSESYADAFEENIKQLKEHAEARTTTENVFESLIDMAGIDFPDHDRTWSLFSGSWQQRPRIVTPLFGQMRVDFDHSGQSTNCHMVTPL